MAKIASKRVVAFSVPQTAHELVRVQKDVEPYFYDQLHQHPEIQVMLIEEGEGTLIAGDYVGRFQPGDVYIIGGGQPHVFRSDPVYYQQKLKVESTSLYFNEKYFGRELWEAQELTAVRELAQTSRHGLQILSPDAGQAAALVHQIASTSGMTRAAAFFSFLEFVSRPKTSLRKLSLQPGQLRENEESRMNKILEFTFRECQRKIYLEEVAQLANLSVEAFCRYFKLHTRKSYVSFLNEVRVSNACQMLIRQDFSVDQIAGRSGFTNASNFNRIFKKTTGKRPLEFRRHARPE